MSVPLPALSNPCITAASSTSVYLLGIPNAMGGHLQMFSVSLSGSLDAPVAVPIGKEQVTSTWAVQAKMACISYGAITSTTHDTVLLVQVDKTRTDVANLRSNGVFDYPVQIPDSTLNSSKLLTQVGAYSTFAWFTGEQISQAPTKTPFMAVGTYDISTKSSTQGHSIVFDSATSGVAYPAIGNAETLTGAVSLSAPIVLDMQGITLTYKSIPVTMGSVAYILDEATDGSIVAYTITPSNTNKLSTISITGKAPSFLNVQSATSLNNKIVVYTVSNSSVASMNVFDAVARTWSGPGLIGSGTSNPISRTTYPSNEHDGNGFPVVPVVGGLCVLTVVVCIVYWMIRSRRQRQKNHADNNNSSKDEDELSAQKLEMDPRQQKHSILTLHEEATSSTQHQNQAQQQQQQQQQHRHTSHYPSIHSAPFNVYPHSAPLVPAPPPMKDYMSHPHPPYNPQYIQNVPFNPHYREEEGPLGWK
ncbi:hypothetical protein BGZ96_009408 [Linnemannia gamsii]|uniref:Transmembrane protein n=1 Tax=Linnemannia gamsii TaxID=64522 RepID=A0ABQ7KCT4_9FUNG|nr:hypothetical protein BGZ96_009408 [Linnemannia gamsii]